MQEEQDLVLAEVIIKVSAMEKLLVKANIFTPEELTLEMKKISDEVIKYITKNAATLNKN